jgi:ribonuclease III family protein
MEIKSTLNPYDYSLGALSENKVRELPVLNLAYIGDTVYDLYIRGYLVKNNMGMVEGLHKLASGVVNARSQAEVSRLLAPLFTEREADIFRSGKNAKSLPTKNMSREDYSQATGLEAVIGYLYLTGHHERTDGFFKIITDHFFGGKKNA